MRFDYLEPKTIEEAISLLIKHNGKAKVIAGGTDLLVQVRDKAIQFDYAVDIGCIAGLNYINYDEKQGLSIGALTPIRALEQSTELRQRYPVICQAASLLGSVAIRNVATIGGNLCNAAPSAEMAPALIATAPASQATPLTVMVVVVALVMAVSRYSTIALIQTGPPVIEKMVAAAAA